MPLSPERTVAELRELQELTGDENGAQRVAWTETWERARGYALTQAALIVPYYEHTNPHFSAMARRTVAMVVEDVGNVLSQRDPAR